MKNPFVSFSIAILAVFVATPAAVQAATLANDNAANSTYLDGWSTTDNGGSGFQAWSTLSQTFIGNSTTNNADDTSSSTSLGINTGGTNAWGLFSNQGVTGTAQAIRPFTGNLSVGQSFKLAFDNGTVATGGTVGFGLQDSTGTNRFEFFFVGNQSSYTISGSTNQSTSHGFTADGMTTTLTLTGADTFSFSITFNSGVPTTENFSGTLKGTTGSGIAQVRLFDSNPNGQNTATNANDVYYNSMAIVPEPSTATLLLSSSILGGFYLMRRRRA